MVSWWRQALAAPHSPASLEKLCRRDREQSARCERRMGHEGLGAATSSDWGAASRASESLADRVQAKTALLMVVRALPLPPCLPAKRKCLPAWVFCRPTCPLDVG